MTCPRRGPPDAVSAAESSSATCGHPELSYVATRIKYMFDKEGPGSVPASTIPIPDGPVPLERLEEQICELAGHLTAATCRFLVLLADFDARRGWASWEMNSCAQWLSWKC